LSLLDKLETILILVAIGLGLALGQVGLVGPWAKKLISPFLVVMLFGLFVKTPLAEIGKCFKNLKFTLTSLGINFIWIPILGYGLGAIFLQNPDLRIGYLMLLVTPCTDWYLIFTALAKGNVTLSTSILPMNLIVQVILLPFYLLIFAGLAGSVQLEPLAASVFWTVILPLGSSLLIKWLIQAQSPIRQSLDRFFAHGVFLFLWLAIFCVFASEARQVWDNPTQFKILFPPVILFFGINFFVGRLAGSLGRFSHEDSVSLTMTTLARNSPVALAVAVVAFPAQPLIALALVIGPLIELPVLAVVAQALLWIGRGQRSRALNG
jgi:ACR3 family arsenite efflux pump ArsB